MLTRLEKIDIEQRMALLTALQRIEDKLDVLLERVEARSRDTPV